MLLLSLLAAVAVISALIVVWLQGEAAYRSAVARPAG